jgi:Abnormal spindle-like microcephaly-assoc'd, ASPM-SPD-2-Hydin
MLHESTAGARARTSRRARLLRRIAPLAAAAVGATMVAAPAYAGVGTHGPIDPGHGFATWYDDGAGHKLQLCLDGPPHCLAALPDATKAATVGASPAESNFPDEAFWWSAEASIPTANGGEARLILAQEAAFAGEEQIDGEQIAFGRVRVRASGLTPGERYRVTHPYGTRTFVAEAADRNINFTRDIGCGVPCDFSAPGGSDIGPPFLQWDPNVPPAPPAGYIGDPSVQHPIIGSPSGNNLFRIERVDANGKVLAVVGETKLFALEGKLAGPDPDPVPDDPAPLPDHGVGTFGAIDPDTGFPTWYQDSTGRQYELCLEGPLCLSTLPDPGQPAKVGATAAESNFPDEAFWWAADAGVTTASGVDARLVLAQEAAFAAEEPIAGEQIAFGRVRVRVTGLQAGAKYRVTHPYGTKDFVAEAGALSGEINATRDIGCGVPCDFSAPGHSDVGPEFLRWDPAVAPQAPAGYVGDPAVPHAVVGSPTGNNVFRIERLNADGTVAGVVAQTTQFAVQGKLAAPPLPPPAPVAGLAPTSLTYAEQEVGTTSAAQTVTLMNSGNAGLTVSGVSLGGTNQGDFVKGADTCTNATLASGQTCTVAVSFKPTAAGTRTASLTFTDNAAGSPRSVSLTGTGFVPQPAGASAIATDQTALAFPTTVVGSTPSPSQSVTVTNTGTADLHVSGATLTGRNASEFAVESSTCGTPVLPGKTCTILVAFKPVTAGAKTASLAIASDAPSGVAQVSLSGQGRQGGGAPAGGPVGGPRAR